MYEHNGFKMPPGCHVNIDGQSALRVWNKGKCDIEVGAEVAALCGDSEALAKIIKDRRVKVRTAALHNPNLPWAILVEKASWRNTNERSSSVRYQARETMRKAAMKNKLTTALGWLADGQTRDGYELVFRTSKATDEELIEAMDLSYTDGGGSTYLAVEGISDRDDLHKRGDDVLLEIAKRGGAHLTRAARVVSSGGAKRLETAWKILEMIEEKEGAGAERYGQTAVRSLMAMRGMGEEFHRELFERSVKLGFARDESQHMTNPESPWDLWEGCRVDRGGSAVDVVGKALASKWGDDAEAWGWAGSMIGEFSGTVGEFISMLEIFHPAKS